MDGNHSFATLTNGNIRLIDLWAYSHIYAHNFFAEIYRRFNLIWAQYNISRIATALIADCVN